MPPTSFFTAIALLLLASTGCSFDRQWRSLRRAEATAILSPEKAPPADALAGRWDGKWVSERSGHSGSLRAIISRVGEKTYRVDYDATFLAVMRFGYGMELKATPAQDRAIAFKGEENLGSLAGGVYQYSGSTDGMTYRATYESSADNGYFEMVRPAGRK